MDNVYQVSKHQNIDLNLSNISSIADETEFSTVQKTYAYGDSNETYSRKFFGYKRYPEV